MSVTEPRPSQRGHMPPVRMSRLHGPAGPALDRDPTARPDRRDVERERAGRPDVRLPEPAEEDAQHRVGVGGGADRRAGVGTHPLLVDADHGRQSLEHVDLGPRQRRHQALHEGAVGLVDQPLGLGGDRAERQRALPRAGDTGEHGQPALREFDADVLEVVHAGAVHADQVVGVGDVQPRGLRARPRGHAQVVSIGGRGGLGRPSRGVAWLDPASVAQGEAQRPPARRSSHGQRRRAAPEGGSS